MVRSGRFILFILDVWLSWINQANVGTENVCFSKCMIRSHSHRYKRKNLSVCSKVCLYHPSLLFPVKFLSQNLHIISHYLLYMHVYTFWTRYFLFQFEFLFRVVFRWNVAELTIAHIDKKWKFIKTIFMRIKPRNVV